MRQSISGRGLGIRRGLPMLSKSSGPRLTRRFQSESWHVFSLTWRHIKRLLTKVWRVVKHYHLHYATLIALAFLAVLQILLLVVNNARSNSPILGLHFHGKNITRYNRGQVSLLAQNAISDLGSKPVNLSMDGKVVGKITPRQLGARYSLNSVVDNIYSYGRHTSLWQSIITQDKVLFGMQAFRLGFPDINKQLTSEYLKVVDQVGDRSPVNAGFELNHDQLSIKKEQPGINIAQAKALVSLQNYDASLDGPTLKLPTQTVPANITKKDVGKLTDAVHQIIDKPVTVQVGNQTLSISKADLLSCLTVTQASDPRQPHKTVPTLTYASSNLDRVVAKIIRQFDKDPVPKVVQGQNTVVAGADGQMADGIQTKINLLTLLISRQNDMDSAHAPLRLNLFPVSTVTLPKTVDANYFNGQLAAYKNGKPAVTFSFSGVPNATYTSAIIDALSSNHISGIFMLTGRNVATYPDITKTLVSKGQRLGLSTYSYQDISSLANDKLKTSLDQTKAMLNQVSGQSPNIVQAPYNHLTASQTTYLSQNGYQVLPATLDSLDWANLPNTVIVKEVVDRVKPGSVIMFHALNHATAEVLPILVNTLKQRGYVIN